MSTELPFPVPESIRPTAETILAHLDSPRPGYYGYFNEADSTPQFIRAYGLVRCNLSSHVDALDFCLEHVDPETATELDQGLRALSVIARSLREEVNKMEALNSFFGLCWAHDPIIKAARQEPPTASVIPLAG